MDSMTCFSNGVTESKGIVEKPFGIDLGTTNSAISVGMDSGDAQIITLENGKNTMPSVVMWIGDKEDVTSNDTIVYDGVELPLSSNEIVEYKGHYFVVGQAAYDAVVTENIVSSVKRLMQSTNATVELILNGKKLIMEPAEVSSLILKGLVQQTNRVYGDVKKVVVTVPAYFNQTGLSNTKRACELAGLECMNILREPTSAALCYNLDKAGSKVQYALVYDLGGGTFDISLIRISERKSLKELYKLYGITPPANDKSTGKLIEPQFIDGDGHLGGDDYDHELYKRLLTLIDKKLKEEQPDKVYDLSKLTPISEKRLTRKVENAKKQCDVMHEFHVEADLTTGEHFSCIVNFQPQDFVDSFIPIYNRTRVKTNNVLRNAHCDVDTIVLMGGSTKNPILTELLKKDYPGLKINAALDPDESVAKGAGIKARNFMYGDDSVQIFDVIPLSLGILGSGKVIPVIKQNSQLPITACRSFTTSYDNQDFIKVQIYQGNSAIPEECECLGELVIDGITPAPKGTPDIAVILSINSDCLLTCKVSIDGKEKELQLHLNTEVSEKNLKAEDKNVIRWRRFAKNNPAIADELNSMLDNYPEKYSKEDITAFIAKHRTKVVARDERKQ